MDGNNFFQGDQSRPETASITTWRYHRRRRHAGSIVFVSFDWGWNPSTVLFVQGLERSVSTLTCIRKPAESFARGAESGGTNSKPPKEAENCLNHVRVEE